MFEAVPEAFLPPAPDPPGVPELTALTPAHPAPGLHPRPPPLF